MTSETRLRGRTGNLATWLGLYCIENHCRKEFAMSLKSLGEPLPGPGNLYPWGEGQILKLYGDNVPKDWVERLNRVESALHQAGLPVPAVGELIEIEGDLGQVYERIEGRTIAEAILGSPEVDPDTVRRLAHLFAETHARIHDCSDIPAELPTRQLLGDLIRDLEILPPDLKGGVLKALGELPDNGRLCHGDFHPYNVLISPRGPVVIDWNNAHVNNPLEDVARSRLLLIEAGTFEPAIRSVLEPFSQAYLERYFQIHPADQDELDAWMPVVTAVRLIEGIYDNQDWLLEQIRTGLGR